jgi:hypothetical protein
MTMDGAVITIAKYCGYLIAFDTSDSHLLSEVNVHDVVFKHPTVNRILLRRIWVLVEHGPQLVEELGIRIRSAIEFLCHGLLLSIAALVTPAALTNGASLASGDELAMNSWRTS